MKKTTTLLLSTLFGITTNMSAQSPVMLKDIRSGSNNSDPSSFAVMNGSLYFTANEGTNGAELWKSDGTISGTTMLKDIKSGSQGSTPLYTINSNNTLYFDGGISASFSRGLYKSDGTSGGTTLVKTMTINNLIDVNGSLFIIGDGDGNGLELWKSDGTAAGTVLVKDIKPGSSSSSIGNQAVLNNKLIFAADDGVNGRSIWISDGTTAGTTLVKSFGVSLQSGIVVANGLGFFSVNTSSGTELWKTDGTTGGTVLVKDIYPGSQSSSPGNLTAIGNTLYFSAIDGTTNGTELWKTDGTSAGTTLVKDVSTGTPSSSPHYFTDVNGILYFVAYDASTGDELWKSDGTDAGTVMVKDIVAGTGSPFASWAPKFINVNGTLFFTGNDPVAGKELWKSDGTSGGTVLLGDINPGSGDPMIANLTSYNNNLYFSANDGTNGNELWTLSGTTGIKKYAKESDVLVHPNPSNGIYHFESENLIKELKIYTLMGDVIYNQELYSSKITINLSGQAKGVYFYQLQDAENRIISGKLIIE